MNLVSLLQRRAAEHPDTPALIDRRHGRDRIVTYSGLWRRVAGGAAMLEAAGLRPGMTILAFHPVSIELYEFLLAAFHRGLQVMLADPSAGRSFLGLCCARRAPDAFFGSWKANWLRLAVPALRRIPLCISADRWFPGTHRWTITNSQTTITTVENDHPALLTFTSGSTGTPKAAVRSHGFLLAQHRALAESLQFTAGEVDLITLPVFVLANLASGMTSVLADTDLAHPGSPDAEAIHRQCLLHRVTRCAASPAFFDGLLRSNNGIPPFQRVFTGGAPVFPDLLDSLSGALPDALIESVYGSTEAEPIAHFAARDADESTRGPTASGGGLCAGHPVPQIHLRVIADRTGQALGPLTGDAFDALEVTSGQVGEIVVTGEHVLQGYLDGVGNEETKIEVAGTVWHRTGDAGWIDPDGRVWLLGRCSAKLPPFPAPPGLPHDALRYPFAIECALRQAFPGIRMAAIEWHGRRALATGGRSTADLQHRIREASGALGIQQWFHLDALPLDRRHNAKIDYPALAAAIRASETTGKSC